MWSKLLACLVAGQASSLPHVVRTLTASREMSRAIETFSPLQSKRKRTMLTRFGILAAFLVSLMPADAVRAGDKSRPPNIVFILTDDQGYGDVGCFGAKKIK